MDWPKRDLTRAELDGTVHSRYATIKAHAIGEKGPDTCVEAHAGRPHSHIWTGPPRQGVWRAFAEVGILDEVGRGYVATRDEHCLHEMGVYSWKVDELEKRCACKD